VLVHARRQTHRADPDLRGQYARRRFSRKFCARQRRCRAFARSSCSRRTCTAMRGRWPNRRSISRSRNCKRTLERLAADYGSKSLRSPSLAEAAPAARSSRRLRNPCASRTASRAMRRVIAPIGVALALVRGRRRADDRRAKCRGDRTASSRGRRPGYRLRRGARTRGRRDRNRYATQQSLRNRFRRGSASRRSRSVGVRRGRASAPSRHNPSAAILRRSNAWS